MSAIGWVKSQLFSTLPYPDDDCTGRTVIVTGASSGTQTSLYPATQPF